MTDRHSWREFAARLIDEALEGRVKLEEFHQRWPSDAGEPEFARRVFDDLEDAVEHFPGQFLTGQPDERSWRTSDARRRIAIDLAVLRSDATEAEALSVRAKLLADDRSGPEGLGERVRELLAQIRSSA